MRSSNAATWHSPLHRRFYERVNAGARLRAKRLTARMVKSFNGMFTVHASRLSNASGPATRHLSAYERGVCMMDRDDGTFFIKPYLSRWNSRIAMNFVYQRISAVEKRELEIIYAVEFLHARNHGFSRNLPGRRRPSGNCCNDPARRQLALLDRCE